jgi:hypothetical protein
VAVIDEQQKSGEEEKLGESKHQQHQLSSASALAQLQFMHTMHRQLQQAQLHLQQQWKNTPQLVAKIDNSNEESHCNLAPESNDSGTPSTSE